MIMKNIIISIIVLFSLSIINCQLLDAEVTVDKKKLIRYNVGFELELKYIPELRFYHDDSMEYAEKIDKLINKIHSDA